MKLLQMLSKSLQVTNLFLTENISFYPDVIFKKEPLREILLRYGRTIYGHFYFKDRDAPGGTLLISG
jgi:hypothetical protein